MNKTEMITKLIKWESKLDTINCNFGDNKVGYCIFCESVKYDGKHGILHEDYCIIQEIRNIIKTQIDK